MKTARTNRPIASCLLRWIAAFALLLLPLMPQAAIAGPMADAAGRAVHSNSHCAGMDQRKGGAAAPACCKDFCVTCLAVLPLGDAEPARLLPMAVVVPVMMPLPFPTPAPRTGPPRRIV